MSNHTIVLTQDQKFLLELSAKDLIKELQEEPDSLQARQASFGVFSAEGNEEYQVQVIVTRDTGDFFPFLQTEHTTGFSFDE